MTEQEAIGYINSVFDEYFGDRCVSNTNKFAISQDMAIEALEKQIPKKPKIVETDMDGMDMETGEEYTYKIDEAHCCNCDSVIGNEYDRFDSHYCNICGQRIDWSCWE